MADKSEQEQNNPTSMEGQTPVDATAPEASTESEQVQGTGEISELLARMETLSAEVEEHRNRYLRTMADLENFRKRALRDKEEARRYAHDGLLGDMIPVLDNLSLGLDAARQHDEGKVFVQGFEMVLSQLKGVFVQHGLVEINPTGETFDPNYHEAVAQTPSEEVEEGKVLNVVRIGYRLHDRLLRPATVVVSSGPSAQS